MIVHQAERTARPIAHAHVQHEPEADGDTSAPITVGPKAAADLVPAPDADAPVDPGSPGYPWAPGLAPGHATGRPAGRSAGLPPGTTVCTAMGRGLGSVLDDERRNWWSSTAVRSRFDRRGGEPAGRWPAAASDEPRIGRQVLHADPGSPQLAREFSRDTLAGWRLGHLCDEVTLVVSELVTNALCHGLDGAPLSAQQCPVQLVLLGHRRRLVAVVTDPGDTIPVRSEQGPAAESGRGLCVVAAISAAWGWAPLATGGKAVWAAVEITPATGDPSRSER